MNFQSSELPSCLGGGWVPSRLCSGPHCLQDAGGRFDAQRQVRGEEHAVGGVSCGTSVGIMGPWCFSTACTRLAAGPGGGAGMPPGMLLCSLLAMAREPARPPSCGGFRPVQPPLVFNTFQIVNLGKCRSVYAWVYQVYHDVFITFQHCLSSSFPGCSEGNGLRPTIISYCILLIITKYMLC